MAFTEALLLRKGDFVSRQKRAFIQEILFSFFKRDTLAQKKGHFFHFQKKGGGTHAPIAPRFRGP